METKALRAEMSPVRRTGGAPPPGAATRSSRSHCEPSTQYSLPAVSQRYRPALSAPVDRPPQNCLETATLSATSWGLGSLSISPSHGFHLDPPDAQAPSAHVRTTIRTTLSTRPTIPPLGPRGADL